MAVAFFVHLLCAIVSCAPRHEAPQNTMRLDARLHRKYSLEAEALQFPRVMTAQGEMEGFFMKTIRGRNIYAFESVPYAEPPVGDRQFRPPAPKKKWKGLLEAKRQPPLCLQVHGLRVAQVMGSEDCLYLNVYTPKLQKKPPLPVIIFLHGGSFLFGGAQEYGPAYLLEEDVILVVINYRVGLLGFLSTGDKACPGNMGLKDQARALAWVHENIGLFGGDPFRITLMGQSGGGASAHLHMMSPMSKDLLHNAISLSGNAFNYWAVFSPERARMQREKLARLVRCPVKDSVKLMNCLRRKNPVFLINAQRHMANWKSSELIPVMYAPQVIFGPVVESQDSPSPFLSLSPDEAYARGEVAKIPWISTILEHEGNFGLAVVEGLGGGRKLKRNWNQVAKYVLDYSYLFPSEKAADAFTERINQFYLGNQTAREVHSTRLGDILTDRYFSFGHLKSLVKHSAIAPTYGYLYKFHGRAGSAASFNFNVDAWGSSHADDVPLIFNSTLYADGLTTTERDFAISKLLTNIIAGFSNYGEPLLTRRGGEVEDQEAFLRLWEPVRLPPSLRSSIKSANLTSLGSQIQLLEISEDVRMVSHPFGARVDFWRTFQLPDMMWT